MKLVFNIFLMCLAFCSCTLQKRVHQKGYYVDWAFHKPHEKEISPSKIAAAVVEPKAEDRIVVKNEETILASSEISETHLSKRKFIFPTDTCGDELVQKNGDRLKVKVLEVRETVVKYTRCDNRNGPTYTVKKSNLSVIIYANGVREVVEAPAEMQTPLQYNGLKEYPGDLVLALVLCFVLGGFAPIFSIPLAKKSKEKIKMYPDKYKGTSLADFIIFFSWGLVILFALELVLLGIFDLELVSLLIFIGFLIFMGFAAYHFYKRK